MPRSGIADSSVFSFLRNLHTILPSGCTRWHSHQQRTRVSCSPHLLQRLLLTGFLMMAILTVGTWYPIVVLISLIISDIEHLFMCSLAICVPSLENVYLDHLPISWLGCLFSWYWMAWAACIFWRVIPCLLLHWQIFSPVLWVSFSLCLWFSLLCKTF